MLVEWMPRPLYLEMSQISGLWGTRFTTWSMVKHWSLCKMYWGGLRKDQERKCRVWSKSWWYRWDRKCLGRVGTNVTGSPLCTEQSVESGVQGNARNCNAAARRSWVGVRGWWRKAKLWVFGWGIQKGAWIFCGMAGLGDMGVWGKIGMLRFLGMFLESFHRKF